VGGNGEICWGEVNSLDLPGQVRLAVESTKTSRQERETLSLSLGLLCPWGCSVSGVSRLEGWTFKRLARLLDKFLAPGVPTLVGGAPIVHPPLVFLIRRDVGGRGKCGQPSRGSTAEIQSSRLPRGSLLRMTIRVGTYQCKRTCWSAVAVPGSSGHHMKLSIPRFISQWEDKRTCQHLYAGRHVLFEFLDEL
jgi:hypothetical protein